MNQRYLAYTFLLLMLLGTASFAQYRLPRQDILAQEGIRELVVKKTPLRKVNLKGKDITEDDFDTTTATIKRYVFNAQGKVDSVFMYPNGKEFYRLTVVLYDNYGHAVEYLEMDRDKRIRGRTLFERDTNDGIHSRFWEYGELRSESWYSKDSITTKTLGYHSGGYSIYTYDQKQDVATQRWFKDSVLMREEILDWDSDRGMPTVMHHSFYELEEGKKPTQWQKTFEVDVQGRVVNEHMEFFYDPFLNDNFFERHRLFKGIRQPDEALFELDSLQPSQEKSELFSFDGAEVVYRYDFIYGK